MSLAVFIFLKRQRLAEHEAARGGAAAHVALLVTGPRELERQKQVPELYCARQGWTFEVVADSGSGLIRGGPGHSAES